jgi:hypothetical protein
MINHLRIPTKQILAALALVLTTSLSAQSRHYAFGPIVGVNMASLTNTTGTTPLYGMTYGLFSDYRFSPLFGFEPEVNYSMQGAYKGDEYIKVDYLNIPLVAKLFVTKYIDIQLGPQVAFCLHASGNVKDADGNLYQIQSISDINPFDFDMILGVGYELPKGFMIQARYFMGTAGVDKLGTVLNDKSVTKHNLNSVFQVTLGWKL